MLNDVSPIPEQNCDHETGSRHRPSSGTDYGPEFLNTEWYVLGRVLNVGQARKQNILLTILKKAAWNH
jgi:hypothetical protein